MDETWAEVLKQFVIRVLPGLHLTLLWLTGPQIPAFADQEVSHVTRLSVFQIQNTGFTAWLCLTPGAQPRWTALQWCHHAYVTSAQQAQLCKCRPAIITTDFNWISLDFNCVRNEGSSWPALVGSLLLQMCLRKKEEKSHDSVSSAGMWMTFIYISESHHPSYWPAAGGAPRLRLHTISD